MLDLKSKIKKLPENSGVYIYKDKVGNILYIGKAVNLKNRVASYFTGVHENRIEKMISQIVKIEIQETDSVLEALILESDLIKKYQPKYNIKEKDDKSFGYFAITREKFPRVLILRETDLKKNNAKYKIAKTYGPYTSKKQMETALKIIRRIFPFHSRSERSEKGCLEFQIGLCPGPYAGKITQTDYLKNIRSICSILEGKKKNLIKKLEKEMKTFSRVQEFEKAAITRNKIFSLRHIQDVALINEEKTNEEKIKKIRIEAYDISNISGCHAVGSMSVFDNWRGDFEPNKSQYRKFKIKTVFGINDVGMMKEVLERRFANDWTFPDLIFLDGGKGHLNMAKKFFRGRGLKIILAAVAKGKTRKFSDFQLFVFSFSGNISAEIKKIIADRKLIWKIISEAHRFALAYHRQTRKKNFLLNCKND